MRENDGVRILEITGVPGAGKSTFARDISSDLPHGWVLFSDTMLPGARLFGRRGAQMVALGYFLFGMFSCWSRRWRQIQFAWRGARAASNSWAEIAYLCVNMAFKMGRYEYLVRQKSWCGALVDEGISHLPFNMVDYRTKGKMADPSGVFACFSDMLERIGVLFVDTPEDKVIQRLRFRGHRRLTSVDRLQVERFVACNQLLGLNIREAACKYTAFFAVINGEERVAGRQSLVHFIKEGVNLGK